MYTCHLLLPLFSYLLLLRTVSCIKCFECYTVTHPFYTDGDVARKLCKNFDYSDDFVIDCGSSTYCRKTVMTQVIMRPLVETERGCASQLYAGLTQKYGAWKNERRLVDDIYKEECSHVESYGLKDAKVENCYCKTDLCNSSTFTRHSILSYSLPVVLLLTVFRQYYLFL